MENFYIKILTWIRSSKQREAYFIYTCKCLPILQAILYSFLIIHCLFMNHAQLFYVISIPVSIFTITTILRKIINRQRPYQKYCIRPLFQNKLGQSMPSRHTASATAIALAGYIVSPIIGYVLGFIAGSIGLSRIVSGVHYISDVLFALFLSFLIYGFILLYFPLGG